MPKIKKSAWFPDKPSFTIYNPHFFTPQIGGVKGGEGGGQLLLPRHLCDFISDFLVNDLWFMSDSSKLTNLDLSEINRIKYNPHTSVTDDLLIKSCFWKNPFLCMYSWKYATRAIKPEYFLHLSWMKCMELCGVWSWNWKLHQNSVRNLKHI